MPAVKRFVASAAALALAASAHAQCGGFSISPSSGASIVPGITDIGNHCDDCTTTVALPFPVAIYGVPYTSVVLSSNGNAQFTGNDGAYGNSCLPSGLGVAIMPHWDDLRTDGAGNGIFTSTSGLAPNRVFNIEWRSVYYNGSGAAAFELRLFEDNSHFDVILGGLAESGSSATIGVQHTAMVPTQYSCDTGGIASGTRLTFNCYNGPTGSGVVSPNSVFTCGAAGTVLFTVNVFPGTSPPSTGLTVTGDLSAINGGAAQAFYNDGTHGDVTAGDSTYSFSYVVPGTVVSGAKSVPFTVADAEGRSTSGSVGLQVNACPVLGPDVWVSAFTDVGYYGQLSGRNAYSIGTVACNLGDTPVEWQAGNNQHPVIGQNMYRYMNGRFEQIGQSWLKHGFASTNSGGCGSCQQPPNGGAQLGVACSDAYGSGLNGGQGGLGPRSEVNPTTGVYPMPFSTGDTSTLLGVRLQVDTNDVTPASNPGAIYYGECHYVTRDDAQFSQGGAPAVNGLNNTTYQRLSIPSATATPGLVGSPTVRQPALRAWKDNDPAVSLVSADYVDHTTAAGIVARFWVAGRATSLGNGLWHYEYAVQNLNADRAGGSFAVPVPADAVVTNVGFHGIFAHSGEPYPNTFANPDSWPGAKVGGEVRWNCPEAYQGPSGSNGNALRWGTTYNFRFDCNVAPTAAGGATLGLYKPGAVGSIQALGVPSPAALCDSVDYNNDGLFPDTADIDDFLAVFSGGACSTGNCNDVDFNNDGLFPDTMDIDALLAVFSGGGCVQ
ncbi:MAG: hypothetical protein U0637_11440 [Phycisphaerales bacterium]